MLQQPDQSGPLRSWRSSHLGFCSVQAICPQRISSPHQAQELTTFCALPLPEGLPCTLSGSLCLIPETLTCMAGILTHLAVLQLTATEMWLALVQVLARFGAEQTDAVCNHTLLILQRSVQSCCTLHCWVNCLHIVFWDWTCLMSCACWAVSDACSTLQRPQALQRQASMGVLQLACFHIFIFT